MELLLRVKTAEEALMEEGGTLEPADFTGQLYFLMFPPPLLRSVKYIVLTFNFSPIDSNFCYWNFKELCYVKQFYIKCPEIQNILVFIFKKSVTKSLS